MKRFTTRKELKSYLSTCRSEGLTIGFTPTMGALHEGHISLINRSVSENDISVCSIFVNPTQFNNSGDLDNYPRTLDRDLKMLAEAGCQAVFIPEVKEMYPEDDNVAKYEMDFGILATVMEGKFRPGHFRGVALVVGKFLDLILPDRSYFGAKDYQQLQIVTELNRRLGLKGEIVGCDIMRETDGLAMSSRNLRLTEEQRTAAPLVYQMLNSARERIQNEPPEAIIHWVSEQFEKSPLLELEYFEIRDSYSLEPVVEVAPNQKVNGFMSVFAGEVRLIDNMVLFD